MTSDDRTIDLLPLLQPAQELDQLQIRLIAGYPSVVSYRAGETVHASGSEVEALLLIMADEFQISDFKQVPEIATLGQSAAE